MAATTISAQSVIDDDGTGTTGTIWNAAFQATFEAAINALFSSTTGITLNQAGGDGNILSLESSDVAHGMTSIAGAAQYGACLKYSATDGGLRVRGFSDANAVGVMVQGLTEIGDSTKTTAGTAAVMVDGQKRSGTSTTALGANENIAAFSNAGTVRFILDGDGDSHQDVGTAWTNFDIFDDIQVMNALAAALSPPADPLRTQFGHLLEQFREALVSHRIVTFNENGHHFINWTRFHMLHVGATRQLAARVERLEQSLALALRALDESQRPWWRRLLARAATASSRG